VIVCFPGFLLALRGQVCLRPLSSLGLKFDNCITHHHRSFVASEFVQKGARFMKDVLDIGCGFPVQDVTVDLLHHIARENSSFFPQARLPVLL